MVVFDDVLDSFFFCVGGSVDCLRCLTAVISKLYDAAFSGLNLSVTCSISIERELDFVVCVCVCVCVFFSAKARLAMAGVPAWFFDSLGCLDFSLVCLSVVSPSVLE